MSGAELSGARAPDVSVVVPARDAERSLPLLLESLARQTLARARFEIVVVDNASRDDTAAVAAAGDARVVSEPVPGRARARNTGARAARGAQIAFVDADCTAEPQWLEALSGCLEHAQLAGGAVRLVSGEPPNAVERLEVLWRFRQEHNVTRSGWSASANLGIRRTTFEALGGFDVAYRHIGEDVDLCLRARAAGHELAWCPDAVVSHPVESRVGEVLRRGLRHGYSSTQHHYRLPGRAGRRYWRHPGPLVRGDWALRRFEVDPGALALDDRRRLLALARVEYAARVAGSLWAELRRAR